MRLLLISSDTTPVEVILDAQIAGFSRVWGNWLEMVVIDQCKIQSKYLSTVQSMSPVQSPESSPCTNPSVKEITCTRTCMKCFYAYLSHTHTPNLYTLSRWLCICLKSKLKDVFPGVVDFVTKQGRMKFVRPLSRLETQCRYTVATVLLEPYNLSQ